MYVGYIKYRSKRTKSEEMRVDGGDCGAFVGLGVAYEVCRVGKQLHYPTKGLPCQALLVITRLSPRRKHGKCDQNSYQVLP